MLRGHPEKVCQLTGETDRQFNLPTSSQTTSRFGLISADLGYSFEHNGILFFLFGDSLASSTFNGKPNSFKDPPRNSDDNDAIGFSTDARIDPCIKLNFIMDSIGAYKNPGVLDTQGKPAITLRNFEVPIAGISDAAQMYVIFATGYVSHLPIAQDTNSGFSIRTVVGRSEDNANTFQYLYDFSKGPNAKFINVAISKASDGYIYFWGTQGGLQYRKSPPSWLESQSAAWRV
jgi:Domain of unknown function (DUF4185)